MKKKLVLIVIKVYILILTDAILSHLGKQGVFDFGAGFFLFMQPSVVFCAFSPGIFVFRPLKCCFLTAFGLSPPFFGLCFFLGPAFGLFGIFWPSKGRWPFSGQKIPKRPQAYNKTQSIQASVLKSCKKS